MRVLVVRLDAVASGTGDALTVLLPVVDGVRVGGDATQQDRFAASRLRDSNVRHRHFRRNCTEHQRRRSEFPTLHCRCRRTQNFTMEGVHVVKGRAGCLGNGSTPEVPSGVQGQSPGGGSGDEVPKS